MNGFYFVNLLLLFAFFGGSAQAHPSSEIAKLSRLLKGKSLQCEPSDHHPPYDPRYRGDDGYFSLSVKKKEVVISDNGDSGYGFSNGGFRDLSFSDARIYLSVGDDGFQTLVFDFDGIGASSEYPENCGTGVLLDASDGSYSAERSIDLTCCLK